MSYKSYFMLNSRERVYLLSCSHSLYLEKCQTSVMCHIVTCEELGVMRFLPIDSVKFKLYKCRLCKSHAVVTHKAKRSPHFSAVLTL